MEDKEVGKLWATHRDVVGGLGYSETIANLIRKLVEERSKRYPNFTLAAICESFGIDPETFK